MAYLASTEAHIQNFGNVAFGPRAMRLLQEAEKFGGG
jgi:hypothetical protein